VNRCYGKADSDGGATEHGPVLVCDAENGEDQDVGKYELVHEALAGREFLVHIRHTQVPVQVGRRQPSVGNRKIW